MAGSALADHLRGFGYLFYAISPNETTFETVEDIPKPDYLTKAAPYFASLIIIEQITLKLQGKDGIRLNDAIGSISNGMMMNLKDVFIRGMLVYAYSYIYEHHRMWDLPWDSVSTWILAALGADFAYYWVHRAAHEINLLWAAHQVHHSSEEYNLTTALRQSIFQLFGSIPFYLPLAVAVPPSLMLVHIQFNTLFQFWIHTECIDSLGPLEHVLNTPQHHRVHHGSNRYCLDKNYAGALIIWDRMFGTFEWERKDEKTVYGLVDQPQFFDPWKHQMFYYGKIWEKVQSMDNLSDKISAVVKGPGWFPGTPRLGDLEMVPEIQHRQKYDPHVPLWINLYIVVNFVVAFYMVVVDVVRLDGDAGFSQWKVLLACAFIFWSLTTCGQIYDGNPIAWKSEFLRSATLVLLHESLGVSWNWLTMPLPLVRVLLSVSVLVSLTMIAANGKWGNGTPPAKDQKQKKKVK